MTIVDIESCLIGPAPGPFRGHAHPNTASGGGVRLLLVLDRAATDLLFHVNQCLLELAVGRVQLSDASLLAFYDLLLTRNSTLHLLLFLPQVFFYCQQSAAEHELGETTLKADDFECKDGHCMDVTDTLQEGGGGTYPSVGTFIGV